MMSGFAARWRDNRAEYIRWTSCFIVVLGLHAGGAAALLARFDEYDLTANAPVITIDLAPVAAAPEPTPTEMPIGPQQVEAPEEPPPPPPPEVSIEPPKPPEKPPEKKKKVAKLTTAPAPADRIAPAAAPAPGAGARDSNALPNWKSMLVAVLERAKRYPSEARSRGDQGIAQLAFSVDRSGGVHNARIVRSSGSSLLDDETLALLQRAAPLPPPPAEMGGGQIAIVVPIRYTMR